MPTLITKQVRRRTAAPYFKANSEDVYDLVLETLNLEPMSSNKHRFAPAEMDKSMPVPAESSSISRKLTFLDLPSETQKGIFRQAAHQDLVALSLVSKHFHELAAEQLYRTFHIVFPDEDDPINDTPLDGLAGGLDTFATSEHDYAQYLREVKLETLSSGHKGERAYGQYLFDVSCGKFMNTLFLLTLRKARALETFKWDIRVELSRPVYKALHNIHAIQHLHLRMQAGDSLHQAPPVLPSLASAATAEHGGDEPNSIDLQDPTDLFSSVASGSDVSIPLAPSSKKSPASEITISSTAKTTYPTLSGFKNLKSLSILDMDSLEYIDELKACVRNCSTTLSSLKLSFSESLANRSRKPPPDVHSDSDSEQEDEFGGLGGMPPVGLPSGTSMAVPTLNGPSQFMIAQQEKKKQEAVLGRILGIDTRASKKVAPPEETKPLKPTKIEEDPRKRFMKHLAPVAAKVMALIKPGSEASAEGKETLSMIEKAANLYIDSIEEAKSKPSNTASDGSSTPKATPASSISSADVVEETIMPSTATSDERGLFEDADVRKKRTGEPEPGLPNPDDIDIEVPESDELELDGPGSETQDSDTPTDEPSHEIEEPETVVESNTVSEETVVMAEVARAEIQETNTMPDTRPSLFGGAPESSSRSRAPTQNDRINLANNLQMLSSQLAIRASSEKLMAQANAVRELVNDCKEKVQSGTAQPKDYKTLGEAEVELQLVVERVKALSAEMQNVTDQFEEMQKAGLLDDQKVSEYIRDTRGLMLTSLSIYLIPLKASVLSKTIDLHVLQRITLLNVGPQIQFWNVLARENKLHPLPLHSIHTDNVTIPFLAFITQLPRLTELFILERAAKARVESTAAKTIVIMDQIRKLVLKRHVSTLKVLMIQNDAGSEWDIDVKTIVLLCQQAKRLEELACSFGIRTLHALLQGMPNMTALRALHTFQYRCGDDCGWVRSEYCKFVVDVISHNPQMQLEYLALDLSLDRLARRKATRPKKSPKSKGKSKDLDLVSAKALAQLALGNNESGSGWGYSSSTYADLQESSDDEDGLGNSGLRIESVEGIRFCDVVGVRIFEKEIRTGRL